MISLISVIVAIFSAVSPSAMPNNYHAVNIAEAKTNTLAYSVLEVEEIPHPHEKAFISAWESGKEMEFPEILKRIEFCESGGKHFDKTGKVLRGKENPNDIGLFQINLLFHLETSQKMGLDIFKEEDNKKYALWLYKKNGTKDWEASKECWEQKERTD